MKMLLAALVLAAGFSTQAFAGELDNEGSVTNKSLQGTLVVRLNNNTKEAAVVQTGDALTSPTQAQALAQQTNFQPVGSDKVRTELDKDGGASSWYFYCGNYGYNNYNYYGNVNWYGNWYTPYYTYNYSYYTYYYYSNSYWGNYWR